MPRSEDEIESYLLAVLKRVAPEADISKINPEKNLRRQMKIDSLDFLKALLIIHEDTGYSVPETDYRQLATLRAMIEYFLGKI